MRIGIITGEYPPMQGGVGAYSQILAQTFADQGHDVFVLSNQAAQENHPGVALNNAVQSWHPRSLLTFRRWAQEKRLDVVNVQYETAAYSMSPWIHFIPDVARGRSVVTTFHDLLFPYLFPKAGPLRDWIVLHLARASDGVIATNQEDLLRLERELGKHGQALRLIPIGSNIRTEVPEDGDRAAWRDKAGAGSDDFLIAYFGFMNHSKGVDILLRDVASVRNEYGYPLKLIMIGGRTGTSDPTNAGYAQEIDRLVAELGLIPHITWTGFVNDKEVSAYLAASDVVALPYRDGASYRRGSLMAAIQHGCAIITTRPRVDIPAFVDTETMLLADPEGDEILIANELVKLYRDADLRQRLRQGAKKLAEHFRWETIARECVSFFEQVIGQTGDRHN